VASDLSWRRLKYWRRLMKQALDPGSVPGAQETVSEVIIEHGPHASVPAWLLLARVARHLGWQPTSSRVDPGVEMVWHFRGASTEAWGRLRRLSDGPSEVLRMRITCKISGQPAVLNMYSEDHRRLVIELEGVPGEPRTLSLPPHSPAEIIGRQLSDRERDPTFRECMGIAQAMARSVLEYT
jgi:glucose-6-phosphate dehydrogenase assembly protein OpcA